MAKPKTLEQLRAEKERAETPALNAQRDKVKNKDRGIAR